MTGERTDRAAGTCYCGCAVASWSMVPGQQPGPHRAGEAAQHTTDLPATRR